MKTTVEALRYMVRLALEDGLSAHDLCGVVWDEMKAEDKSRKRALTGRAGGKP